MDWKPKMQRPPNFRRPAKASLCSSIWPRASSSSTANQSRASPSPNEFSDDDFEALDDCLQRRGKAIFDIVVLDGFLTPIVIGPNTLPPMLWFSRVFGRGAPKFRDIEKSSQFTALVLGFYKNLVAWFEHEPAKFAILRFEPFCTVAALRRR